MEWLTTAVTGCLDIFSTTIGLISETPVLALLFAGGTIIPLGFGLFGKAKHSIS